MNTDLGMLIAQLKPHVAGMRISEQELERLREAVRLLSAGQTNEALCVLRALLKDIDARLK
jgi:hypothetical protein